MEINNYSVPRSTLWRQIHFAVKRKFECLDDDGDEPQNFGENSPAFKHEVFAMHSESPENSDSYYDDGTNESGTVEIPVNESTLGSFSDDGDSTIHSDHADRSEFDVQIPQNSELEPDCSTDSSSLDIDGEQHCLGDDLSDWAVRFQTKHVALSCLLKIIR